MIEDDGLPVAGSRCRRQRPAMTRQVEERNASMTGGGVVEVVPGLIRKDLQALILPIVHEAGLDNHVLSHQEL